MKKQEESLSDKATYMDEDDDNKFPYFADEDVKEAVRKLKEVELKWLKKNVSRLDSLRYGRLTPKEYNSRCETVLKKIIKELKEYISEINKIFGKKLTK